MKTEAEAFAECAEHAIVFDGGGFKKVWTFDQMDRLVYALQTRRSEYIIELTQTPAPGRTRTVIDLKRWRQDGDQVTCVTEEGRPAWQCMDWAEGMQITEFLDYYHMLDCLDVEWLARFESVAEVLDYLHGRV